MLYYYPLRDLVRTTLSADIIRQCLRSDFYVQACRWATVLVWLIVYECLIGYSSCALGHGRAPIAPMAVLQWRTYFFLNLGHKSANILMPRYDSSSKLSHGSSGASWQTALMATEIVALEPRRINHYPVSATHERRHHMEVDSCTDSPRPKEKAVNRSYLLLGLSIHCNTLGNTCISTENCMEIYLHPPCR